VRFLAIILRVLRLEISVYIVYITNQFQTTFAGGGGGGVKSVSRGDCELQGGKLLDFCPKYVQEFGLRFGNISFYIFTLYSIMYSTYSTDNTKEGLIKASILDCGV
jgi:hypothetical protein